MLPEYRGFGFLKRGGNREMKPTQGGVTPLWAVSWPSRTPIVHAYKRKWEALVVDICVHTSETGQNSDPPYQSATMAFQPYSNRVIDCKGPFDPSHVKGLSVIVTGGKTSIPPLHIGPKSKDWNRSEWHG